MTERFEKPSNTPLPRWLRLRRFFHLEGSLSGLRYEARVGIFELIVPASGRNANNTVAAQPIARANSPAISALTASELQVWESEGGASSHPE
jgi:hypothetical protein